MSGHCAALRPGIMAPDFCLRSSPHQSYKLSSQYGAPIVIAFYQADWSPTCTDQVQTLQYFLPAIRDAGGELVGISIDSVWSHQAFAAYSNVEFTLLSDFEPKGEVARSYGVYDGDSGLAHRSLFVIDLSGRITWSKCYAPCINPGIGPILQALGGWCEVTR